MFVGFQKAALALVITLFLVPSLVSAATFERPLSLGMSGTDVSALQTLLKEKGFFAADVTGYYGPITVQAVADFQRSVGLESLGYVGPQTRALLNAESVTPSTAAVSNPSLLLSLITALQQLLRNAGYFMVPLSGVMDQATLQAAQAVSSPESSTDAPKRSGGKSSNSDSRNDEEEEVIAPPVTFDELSLSNASFAIADAPGTLIGAIHGKHASSTLSIISGSGRVALSGDDTNGWNLVVGSTTATAGDLNIRIRESLAGSTSNDTDVTLMAMAEDRAMFFTTRARVPSGTLITATTSTNYVMTRLVFDSAQYATNDFRIHYSGFALSEGGTSPQETQLPVNATVIDQVYVRADDVNYPLLFAGATSTTIASGALGAWTDAFHLEKNLPSEGTFEVFTLYHTAVGEKQIPVYRIQKERGERVWGAGDAATLLAMLDAPDTASTASFDVNYGAQGQPQFYGPDMMVAKGWDGRPVVLGAVDSLGESRQEFSVSADERGNIGYLRRWMDTDDATYGRTPHFFLGVPGAGSVRELTTNATKRWDIVDQAAAFNAGSALPFTVLVDQLGQNDLQTTYSVMEANYDGFLTRFAARYPGVRRVGFNQFPRTSSTDNYRTRANQTAVTGNVYPTGQKYLLNAHIMALAGGNLDAAIDAYATAHDATYPGTWPEPQYISTLAAQSGTDGVATYSTIQTTDRPVLGDLLRWGTSGAAFGIVISVTGSGPYTATLDRTNTLVATSGSEVFAPATFDGVHPYVSEIMHITDSIPQSEKSKLSN